MFICNVKLVVLRFQLLRHSLVVTYSFPIKKKTNKDSACLFFVYSKSEYCVLKKWVHSKIGQCVRPAGRPAVRPSVYTITLHNHIRLSWNFVHRFLWSISRSSSKMKRIRHEMTALSKKLSSIPEGGVQGFFSKKIFFSELFKTYMNRLSF